MSRFEKRASALLVSLVLLLAGIQLTANAQARHLHRLHGVYGFSGTVECVVSPNGFVGLNPDVGPGTSRWTASWSATGLATFNGDGTGSFEVRNVYVVHTDLAGTTGGGGSADATSPFTYTVAADGSFTMDLTAITGAELTGGRAGQTFAVSDVQVAGRVSDDNQTITTATTVPVIETVNYSGGPFTTEFRVCHRARVFAK